MESNRGKAIHKWVNRLKVFGGSSYILPGLPLKGERVTVRAFRRNDEDARQRWAKHLDPYLARYNFSPCDKCENDIAFEKLKDRVRLAIDNANGEMVGYISLKPVLSDRRVAELGVCFCADHVDYGYGSEALNLALPWACETLGLTQIILEVDVLNKRAIRLYEQLGFEKISEFWYTEKNREICEQLEQIGNSEGIEILPHQIRILAWKMKWVDDSPNGLS